VVARLISFGEPEVNKQSLGWMEALINWKARLIVVRLMYSGKPEVNKQLLGWIKALIDWKARFGGGEVDLFRRA
jgi:hypothetical protein